MKRWLDVLIPGLLLFAAVLLRLPAFGVSDSPLLLELRNLVFDSYQRRLPRAYRDDLPVRIVDIDEESLRRLGQWPWPRTLLARLLDRLADAGAAVVTFDILFAEPDRLAPANLLSTWEDRPELADLRPLLSRLPDPDAELATSATRMKTVTAFALTREPGRRKPAEKWGGGSEAGPDPRQFVPQFAGAITTLPAIEAAAQGNGSVNFLPDPDSTVRRAPLFSGLGGKLYPSLAAEAVRLAYGAPSYDIKAAGASGEWSFGQQTGIVAVRIGQPIVPTDEEGAIRLYDSGHRPERFIPAWRLLAHDFDPDAVAGQIVLIGSSAEALKDIKATPLAPIVAGVEIHAQVIEQILGGQFLQRPDWIEGAELLYLTGLGLVLILAIRLVGALWSLLLALAAAGGAIATSWIGFARFGYLIDPLYPCLAALLVYLSGSLIGYLKSESEKRFVRGAMGRYLSPVWVAELSRHPERLALGGETRELTVLFSDIRGFTHIAERLDAHALTQLINRFLTPLTQVIQDSRGFIDKYMGDCIMAFWNAPLDVPDHPQKAARAALAMRAELRRLNDVLAAEAAREGRDPIVLGAGIGVNSGRACVGNMGSEQRFDYSAIGDTVNIASRLEGLSRAYGVDIVIGEATARQLAGLALLELDQVRVKGRAAPLRIYAVLGDEQAAAAGDFATLATHHVAMLSAYRRQDWATARLELSACRSSGASPAALYDVYERRIALYEGSPPPADWDGVFTATTKQG
jgi:adenylate cyclase